MNNVTSARWLLRIGLASVLLYAVIGATLQPANWIVFLPSLITNLIDPNIALKLFSFYELLLAIWLLSAWKTRYAAALMVLTMGGIMLANPYALDLTFRDVAIGFAAAALLALDL